jgi:TRAP-type C4-dicarboxylate transport system permease small subunit
MSHGVEGSVPGNGDDIDSSALPALRHPLIARLDRALGIVNRAVMLICTIALFAAACLLTYSVVTRYFLKSSTDWQDEASVFLLVGSVFLGSGYVQSFRGHIGIEALSSILPPAVNRARMLLVDLASLMFCTFFAWKSWTLLAHAVHEGHTSGSSWAPPLWIPYSTMAAGMTLLSLQVLLQLADRILAKGRAP